MVRCVVNIWQFQPTLAQVGRVTPCAPSLWPDFGPQISTIGRGCKKEIWQGVLRRRGGWQGGQSSARRSFQTATIASQRRPRFPAFAPLRLCVKTAPRLTAKCGMVEQQSNEGTKFPRLCCFVPWLFNCGFRSQVSGFRFPFLVSCISCLSRLNAFQRFRMSAFQLFSFVQPLCLCSFVVQLRFLG